MNKEDILKKSRNENCDEMEVAVTDKSMRVVCIAMILIAAVFAYIRSENGEPMMDLCATVNFSVSAGNFYKFAKLKNKSYIFIAVITLIGGIFATVRFFMGH